MLSGLLGILLFVLWIYTLVNCVQTLEGPTRVAWFLIVFFVPIIGLIFYWLLAHAGDTRSN